MGEVMRYGTGIAIGAVAGFGYHLLMRCLGST